MRGKKPTWPDMVQLLTDAAKSMEAVQHTVNQDGQHRMESDSLIFAELMCRREIEAIKSLHWKEFESSTTGAGS